METDLTTCPRCGGAGEIEQLPHRWTTCDCTAGAALAAQLDAEAAPASAARTDAAPAPLRSREWYDAEHAALAADLLARRRARQERLGVWDVLRQIWRGDGRSFYIGETNAWQNFWLSVGWGMNTHTRGHCWWGWRQRLFRFCPVCLVGHGLVRVALLGRNYRHC